MIDLKSFLLDRLDHVEKYLLSSRSDRSYALGRVLEIESMAFSLRNCGLLTGMEFDRIDLVAERIRTRQALHGNQADDKSGKPYFGRFHDYSKASQ